MAVATMTRCSEGRPQSLDECGMGALERVRYFQRQLLTADDMLTDQDYFRQKMRRHNRLLHGWGVVCGLAVTAAPTADTPWRVRIAEGYALGPQGDEIYVPDDTFLDLAECGPGAVSDPCDPGRMREPAPTGARATVFVAVRYAECLARPVRGGGGCGCDDLVCEYSRVRDGFEVSCLEQPPELSPVPDLCTTVGRLRLIPCPPCPDEPWVVLARVVLPASVEDQVANGQIQNGVRRLLFSTQAIQKQVIECCCEPEPGPGPQPVPVRVATVVPANGSTHAPGAPPAAVTVTFDKDVQAATVTVQTVVVTRTSPDIPSPQTVAGTVIYDAATRTATFRPTNRFTVGTYTVRVRGAGTAHVTDVDALALDGNKDGTQGDDFTSGFVVGQPPVP